MLLYFGFLSTAFFISFHMSPSFPPPILTYVSDNVTLLSGFNHALTLLATPQGNIHRVSCLSDASMDATETEWEFFFPPVIY